MKLPILNFGLSKWGFGIPNMIWITNIRFRKAEVRGPHSLVSCSLFFGGNTSNFYLKIITIKSDYYWRMNQIINMIKEDFFNLINIFDLLQNILVWQWIYLLMILIQQGSNSKNVEVRNLMCC